MLGFRKEHNQEVNLMTAVAYLVAIDYTQSLFTGHTLSNYLGIHDIPGHVTHPALELGTLLVRDYLIYDRLRSPKEFFSKRKRIK